MKERMGMKKIIAVFYLAIVGTTVVPKPGEEYHILDYYWLKKAETKRRYNISSFC